MSYTIDELCRMHCDRAKNEHVPGCANGTPAGQERLAMERRLQETLRNLKDATFSPHSVHPKPRKETDV